MRFRPLIVAASLLVVVAATQVALAVPPFAAVFKKEYLDNNEHKEFAEEAGKAPNSCLVCHQGKSRKNRNEFGKVVGKLLTKKDAKNTEKIATELKKALDMHVDPKDDKSETYLDRVKAGKYPVGDLAELKKEPAKSAGEEEEKK